MNRILFISVAVILVCAATEVAGEPSDALVLVDGTQLDVTRASVEGKLVYVTLATGQMMAYPVEEIDLKASGLAPETRVEAPKPKRLRNLSDARSFEAGGSGATITDQDVGHVDPSSGSGEGQEVGEEGEEATEPVAITISNTSHQIAGNIINLTGKVHNSGTEDVEKMTITATAVDTEGVDLGSGSTTITRVLAVGKDIVFAISFPFEGKLGDIKVVAKATMATYEPKENAAGP